MARFPTRRERQRDPLLLTKLTRPPLRAGLLARPRLVAHLEDGDPALWLIAAPPGFGKTSIVLNWLAQRGGDAAWLTLDANDSDLRRFWQYVSAALDRLQPGVGVATQQLLASPALPATRTLLTTLVNDLATQFVPDESRRPALLVLEDYHTITDPAVHESFATLVDRLPPTLGVVILTRTDPPLPLARWRARGTLCELRTDDLRFTSSEASALLRRTMGLGLLKSQVELLTMRTEGWAAALQLAALSLRASDDVAAFIDGFAGTNRYIMDYLVDEVLNGQPADVQDFLLQTSVLDRLTSPLCATLIGEPSAQKMLERIEHAQLFLIPLDHERRWYRYHHLFADLLRFRLQQIQPMLLPVLHRRAAEWLLRHAMVVEAIPHALSAEDWELAAAGIEQVMEGAWHRGDLARVLNWSAALPTEVIAARPGLCLLQGWRLLPAGRVAEMDRWLERAEASLAADPETADRWRGRIVGMRAYVVRLRDDPAAGLRLAQEAISMLAPDDAVWRAFLQINIASSARLAADYRTGHQAAEEAAAFGIHTGNIHMATSALWTLTLSDLERGALCRAEARAVQSAQLLREHGAEGWPAAGFAALALAMVRYMKSDLAGAMVAAERAVVLGQAGEVVTILFDAYLLLAAIALANGEHETMRRMIEQASALVRGTQVRWIAELAPAWEAKLLARAGRVDEALTWANAHATAIQAEKPILSWWVKLRPLSLAQIWVSAGRGREALAWIDRLLEEATHGGQYGVALQLYALRALALSACGDFCGAEDALGQALAIAAPEGYSQPFVELGEPMRHLLTQYLERNPAAPVASFARQVVSRNSPQSRQSEPLPAVPGPSGSRLSEPLSRREQQVLELMAQGCSNQEIADALVISLVTAKKHATNIFGKLSVSSRTQAVARARTLGLLS